MIMGDRDREERKLERCSGNAVRVVVEGEGDNPASTATSAAFRTCETEIQTENPVRGSEQKASGDQHGRQVR